MIVLDSDKKELVLQYIRPRFSGIDMYIQNVFMIVSSTFSVNSELQLSYSFFYLEGEGATLFQKEVNLDGYVGLGLCSN
jgi:hypothetical protein